MQATTKTNETITGVVQRIDLVQREVSILTAAQLHLFDIPTECPVTLRGERIKLRLLQPGDVVQINFRRGQQAIAQFVEVAPIISLPDADKN